MRILIVGTGALGILFAARLRRAGHEITMLGTWRAGLRALRTTGARLIDISGRELTESVHVASHPRECPDHVYALVLVKAWQTARAAAQLRDCLSSQGLAVTLQNGLGNREVLQQYLGRERVALGVTTTGATLLGPGLARAGGDGTVSIETRRGVAPLVEALRSAGMQAIAVDNAESLIWGKLVANAAINPLSAILQVPNGELLNRDSARSLLADLAGETAQVAASCGITLPFPDPVAYAEGVARQTAANRSSMLQDVRRGAPTEIDAICGEIVRLGWEHQVAVPANYFCWHLVRALVVESPNASTVGPLSASILAHGA